MQVSVLFAVRLNGGRGETFSIINSASVVIVAASLVAEHSYMPRSVSIRFVMVRLPPLKLSRSAGRAWPSFCVCGNEFNQNLYWNRQQVDTAYWKMQSSRSASGQGRDVDTAGERENCGMCCDNAIRTYPTPHNGRAIVSVPVDGLAGQLGRLAQLLNVNRLGGNTEYGRAQHNYANDGRGPVRAEVVVGRARVAARIVLVHLGEEEAAVHLVEHAGHIVRIKQESVLLPAQVLQRRIRSKVAVQNGGLPVGQINLGRCINHLGLICSKGERN